jgi:DNA repair protein RecO (recombination protein O)
MALLTTEAIILRRYPLGETDRIVSIYTKDKGKLRAVAKGALKIRNQWAGSIEPLYRVMATIYLRANSDLHRFTQCEAIQRFDRIVSDLDRLKSAFGVIELLDRFTVDDDPNENLFDIAVEILKWIDESKVRSILLLRYFQIKFFQLSGYRIQLDQCSGCGKKRNFKAGYFCAGIGGVLCSDCSIKISGSSILVSSSAINGIENCQNALTFNTELLPDSVKFIKESGSIVERHFAYYFNQIPRSMNVFDIPEDGSQSAV